MQCRKRAISALACVSRVLQNRTPTAADEPANIASARRRIRDLPGFDQNLACRAAQEPYWMRFFVGSPIYMAGTAPGRIFLFKPADSLSGVTDLTFTNTDFAQLERGECVKGCYALCFCCPTRVRIEGSSTWSALDRDGRSGSTPLKPSQTIDAHAGHCCYPLTGNSYYVVILHESQKSVATVVADLLARVPSTSYSSTSDATIVKLRKDIRDKANVRERKLREAYKLNDFDPSAMNTV